MIEINPENYHSENVLSEQETIKLIEELKSQGKKIGLCTGSFDLLHPGHLTHLESAKKLCDILIVGIAHDNYSKNKKPKSGRPVFSHHLRAYIISKLKPVDFVFIDDCSPETMSKLNPSIYIKGPDYADLKDLGIRNYKKLLESCGGEVAFTTEEKLSTTDILRYIQESIKLE